MGQQPHTRRSLRLRSGVTLGSLWGSFWGRIGVTLGVTLDVILGSLLNHFAGYFGATLGSLWARFSDHSLGSLWGSLWGRMGMIFLRGCKVKRDLSATDIRRSPAKLQRQHRVRPGGPTDKGKRQIPRAHCGGGGCGSTGSLTQFQITWSAKASKSSFFL